MVHNLNVQLVLGHLTADHLHLLAPCEDRKDRRSDFQVVDTTVAVRKQSTGDTAIAVVHRSDHVGLVAVAKPGIDVLSQKFRLLQAHHVIVFRRNVQRRADLSVEQIGRAENLLFACVQMRDAEGAAVLVQMEGLSRSDKVLLRCVLPLKLRKYCG